MFLRSSSLKSWLYLLEKVAMVRGRVAGPGHHPARAACVPPTLVSIPTSGTIGRRDLSVLEVGKLPRSPLGQGVGNNHECPFVPAGGLPSPSGCCTGYGPCLLPLRERGCPSSTDLRDSGDAERGGPLRSSAWCPDVLTDWPGGPACVLGQPWDRCATR